MRSDSIRSEASGISPSPPSRPASPCTAPSCPWPVMVGPYPVPMSATTPTRSRETNPSRAWAIVRRQSVGCCMAHSSNRRDSTVDALGGPAQAPIVSLASDSALHPRRRRHAPLQQRRLVTQPLRYPPPAAGDGHAASAAPSSNSGGRSYKRCGTSPHQRGPLTQPLRHPPPTAEVALTAFAAPSSTSGGCSRSLCGTLLGQGRQERSAEAAAQDGALRARKDVSTEPQRQRVDAAPQESPAAPQRA